MQNNRLQHAVLIRRAKPRDAPTQVSSDKAVLPVHASPFVSFLRPIRGPLKFSECGLTADVARLSVKNSAHYTISVIHVVISTYNVYVRACVCVSVCVSVCACVRVSYYMQVQNFEPAITFVLSNVK